ncbi:MAG: peptide MFS transporter [Hyphomicrobium sp.]
MIVAPSPAAPALGFTSHPVALRTLFFAELWERFSYYGMKALLVLFMVAAVAEGGLGFTAADAGRVYGNYTMAVYMLAIPGGFIADRALGARRSVLIGGWTIALGHFSLACPTMPAFYIGLVLIALGTGLFKPNISALVGGLYGRDDDRRDAGFSLFYMGINIGAFIAPLVTGFLAQSALFKGWLAAAGFDPGKSWHWGFAAAGIGMTIAMLIFRKAPLSAERIAAPIEDKTFWRDSAAVVALTLSLFGLAVLSDWESLSWIRWIYVALPLAGIAWALSRGDGDAKRLTAIGIFFVAAMIFWAIFEQQGSTFSLIGDQLTRTEVFGIPFPSSWYQSINPIFVILLTPFAAALWLSLGSRQPSSAIKFALGLAFLSTSFLLMVPVAEMTAQGRVSPLWIVAVFFLMTIGELLISPVGLATMTRLAPERMTGFVLGLWFLATAFGSKFAGVMGGAFTSTDPAALSQSFFWQAMWVAIAACVLLALAPWVSRLSSPAVNRLTQNAG